MRRGEVWRRRRAIATLSIHAVGFAAIGA